MLFTPQDYTQLVLLVTISLSCNFDILDHDLPVPARQNPLSRAANTARRACVGLRCGDIRMVSG
jgi:hypothetical protein